MSFRSAARLPRGLRPGALRSPRRHAARARAGAAANSIERLNLGALAAVVALHAAARHSLPSSVGGDGWTAILVVATLLVARVAWRTRGQAWTHLVIAAIVLVSVYESLGPLVAAIGPAPCDRWILAVEEALTRGRWPPLTPAPLPSWIIDAFSVAYIAYFALPVALPAA